MSYEELVARVAEAIIATGNNSLELGKALYEAKRELTPCEYNQLLNDERIKYERTQANKKITFYTYSKKCESTHTVLKLGIEKVCVLNKLSDLEQQKQLQDYALDKAISVSEMKKVVAKMKENAELTPSVALEEVRSEKEEAKSNKKQEDSSDNQGLKAENKALKARVTALEKTVAKLRAELQQQQTQVKTAKTSKSAEVVSMKTTKRMPLIPLNKQSVSIASVS